VSRGGEEAPLILESASVTRIYGAIGWFQCEVVGWCLGIYPCCNTPCYRNPKLFFNPQLSPNARTNQVIDVLNQSSNEKIEIQTSIIISPDASVQDFWVIYKV
jgi:hypothetical protein